MNIDDYVLEKYVLEYFGVLFYDHVYIFNKKDYYNKDFNIKELIFFAVADGIIKINEIRCHMRDKTINKIIEK